MKNLAKGLATAVLAALLLVTPLAACSGQTSPDGGAAPSQGGQSGAVDISTLETMGDVLAIEGGSTSAAWTEDYYLYFVEVGDSTIRAYAELTPELYEQISEIDFAATDYDEQLAAIIGDVPLQSVEDISGYKIGQDELDAYVGKTGQDLVDAGFTFAFYSAYGGDETCAEMENGYFSYTVTFDASVPDADDSDGGAAIMDATVTGISPSGLSNEAFNPEGL